VLPLMVAIQRYGVILNCHLFGSDSAAWLVLIVAEISVSNVAQRVMVFTFDSYDRLACVVMQFYQPDQSRLWRRSNNSFVSRF